MGFKSRLLSASLILVLLLPACAQSAATQSEAAPDAPVEKAPSAEIAPPEGSWGGEFKFENDPEWVLLVADFTPSETIPPASGAVELGMKDDTAAIHFEIPFERAGEQGMLSFAGQLQEDKIAGQVTHGSEHGVFELAPLADFAPDYFEGRT
jgi:hypothetical protein